MIRQPHGYAFLAFATLFIANLALGYGASPALHALIPFLLAILSGMGMLTCHWTDPRK